MEGRCSRCDQPLAEYRTIVFGRRGTTYCSESCATLASQAQTPPTGIDIAVPRATPDEVTP